jgi:integrase
MPKPKAPPTGPAIGYDLTRPRKSPFWHVRLKYERGRGTWVSTKKRLKKDAKRDASKRVVATQAANRASRTPVTTLETAYEYLNIHHARKKNSDATFEVVSLKASQTTAFFGKKCDIASITLPRTNAYLDYRRQFVADATIAKEVTYLLAALRACQDEGLYSGTINKLWPPTLAREYPSRKRWLPFDEYVLVLNELRGGTRSYVRRQRHGQGVHGGANYREQRIQHANAMGEDWSDHLIAYTNSGMRLKDLYELTPDHVTTDHLKIPGTKNERARRQVPMALDLVAVLRRRIANVGPDGYLFPLTSEGSSRAEKLDNQERAWLRALKGACKRAGVAHTTTNDLRRTFCTWCLLNGVLEADCIRWMGHSSAKMIREVYGQTSVEHDVKEIAKFPSLDKGDRPVMTPLELFTLN